MMKPTIGRIVHYKVTVDAQCTPVIIVNVNDDLIVGTAFYAGALPMTVICAERDDSENTFPQYPSWHWPERVD